MDEATLAQKTFELNNDVVTLDPAVDDVFRYNRDEQQKALREAPWKKDPHFFKRVRISAVALIKMVMHARSGGVYEIMGLMQGKIDVATQTIYIVDAFALPVQGTETRVSASRDADEFMVEYLQRSQAVGRGENVVGWYHSHPGYGCWLSGIDVSTQMHNQQWQDPFVAIVIDPNRTISAGRVDIGAFRTYPEGYTPPGASTSEYQSIPMSKIEDFGAHANAYYPLKVEYFKSSLDAQLLSLLWNKYWVNTLSQSPLLVNRSYAVGQVRDLAAKLAQARQAVSMKSTTVGYLPRGKDDDPGGGPAETAEDRQVKMTRKREQDTPLAKASQDSAKIAGEAQHGLIAQVLKDALFNNSATGAPLPPL